MSSFQNSIVLNNLQRQVNDLETDVRAIAAAEHVELPISQPLDMNDNSILNVTTMTMEDSVTSVSSTIRVTNNRLMINGNAVDTDEQHLDQDENSNIVTLSNSGGSLNYGQMRDNVDLQQHDVENVRQITLGPGVVDGSGYPQMTVGGNGASIGYLRDGLQFYGSNNTLTKDTSHNLTWGGTPLALTTWAGDQNANSHNLTGVNQFTLTGGHPMSHSDYSGTVQVDNVHLWGFTNTDTTPEFNLLTKPINNAQHVAFTPSGDSPVLTSDADGNLIWNGSPVTGSGSGNVTNPMTSDLAAGNHELTGVSAIKFNNAPDIELGSLPNGILVWDTYHVMTNSLHTSITANQYSILDLGSIRFNATGAKELSSNTDGDLLWGGEPVGAPANAVLNPVESDVNFSSHSITALDSLTLQPVARNTGYTTGRIAIDTVNNTDYMQLDSEAVWIRSQSPGSDDTFSFQVNGAGSLHTRPVYEVSDRGPLGIVSRDSSTDIGYLDIGGSEQQGYELMLNGVALTTSGSASHNLRNIDSIEFESTVSLSSATTDAGTNLLWGGNKVVTYTPSSDTFTMETFMVGSQSPTTSGPYNAIGSVEYPTPEGMISYYANIDVQLTTPIDAAHAMTFYLYACSQPPNGTTGLIDESTSYKIAEFFKTPNLTGTDKLTGDILITALPSNKGGGTLISYGWNIGDGYIPAGYNNIVLCAYTQYEDEPVPYTVSAVLVYFSGTFKSDSLTVGNSVLSTSSDNLLKYDGAQVMTVQTVKPTTTTNTETVVDRYSVPNNTAGILVADWFSENSAFQTKSFVKNDGGSVTVSGTLIHTYHNPDSHVVDLAVNGSQVEFKVTGAEDTTLNWKVRYHVDSVALTVAAPPAPVTPRHLQLTFADAVDISSSFSTPPLTGTPYAAKSISFWVKYPENAGQSVFVPIGHYDPQGVAGLQYLSSSVWLQVSGGGNLGISNAFKTTTGVKYKHRSSIANPPPTEWAHFCITYADCTDHQLDTASDVQVYFNGAHLPSGTDSTATLQADRDWARSPINPALWGDQAAGAGWSVSFRNFAFYDRVLTSGEVTTIHTGGSDFNHATDLSSGLVTYYTMNSLTEDETAFAPDVGTATLPLATSGNNSIAQQQ